MIWCLSILKFKNNRVEEKEISKVKKIICLGLMLFSVCGSNLSFAEVDPNISAEEGKRFVLRAACIAGGGVISDQLDKTYMMCEGGKYDSIIVENATPAYNTSCSLQVSDAKDLVDISSDTVANEDQFIFFSLSAVKTCLKKAKSEKFKSLPSALENSLKACDLSSDQRSKLYLGTCYLKIGDLAQFIISD